MKRSADNQCVMRDVRKTSQGRQAAKGGADMRKRIQSGGWYVLVFTMLFLLASFIFSISVLAEEEENEEETAEMTLEAEEGEYAVSEEKAEEDFSGKEAEEKEPPLEEEAEALEINPEESAGMPDNGIPVLYINIDESRGTIQEMLESSDHSVFCYGAITITVPEGFHYSDFPDLPCEGVQDLSMSIRGRGNSTWHMTGKKPFKLKLDDRADLFGLGANKHWVLVANKEDPSLIRDRITGWLGDEMGFAFTPRGVPVDVVMTGENYGSKYLGSYYFSENVRVDENRVEISELKKKDTDPEIITGGYLLQNALQVRAGSPDRFYTSRKVDWATHTPSFDTEGEDSSVEEDGREDAFTAGELEDAYDNPAQQKYIQEHIQRLEDILFEEGIAYREVFDIESAAKYWMVNIFSLNGDAYATGSTYIYKDRDKDGKVSKLYWGPLWDFDFAWNYRPYTAGMEPGHTWMKPMFYDKGEGGFVEELHKQWLNMRVAIEELIRDGGVIDQYYEETKASAEADREANPRDTQNTYYEDVQELKNWIRERLAWMDENFDLVDELIHKVTFVVNGEEYQSLFLTQEETVTGKEKYPLLDGYTFIGWMDEEGNLITNPIRAVRDMTITAKYADDSEMTHIDAIALNKANDLVKYRSFIRIYQIDYTVIPSDAEDSRPNWTSSDENYATVDENGKVTYLGPGTVTLTANLKNGKKLDFVLTVTEGEVIGPNRIFPLEEEIHIKAGQQAPFIIGTDPSPSAVHDYTYTSEDEGIVTVGEYGVLTGVCKGETKVHVTVQADSSDGEEITLETEVTVIVEEEEPSEITYAFTKGENSSWRKGSSKGQSFTVKRSEEDEHCIDHFTGLQFDGEDLEQDADYTAVSGSTVITLKPETLEKRSKGTHTLTAVFDDGTAETTLKILEKEQKDEGQTPPQYIPPAVQSGGKVQTPNTSDSWIRIWLGRMMASLLVFGWTLWMRSQYDG